MRIFLVGFMASGKTTVGKKMANRLGLKFVDLDVFIEEKYNTTIRSIIYNEGQDVFREKEREALNSVISENKSAVISTGGGTPYYFDNMEKMKNAGETLYIEVDIPTLVDRLLNSKKDRPLIWGKSKADLTIYAKELFERRQELYNKAKYKVNGKDLKIDLVLDVLGLSK
ncbi:MAG: AAA family ATPase [Bacteroidales bacterium]|nr:AAA family ATPase [Bacteroidales bacterium]